MPDNDLILYTTDDGQARFVLRQIGGQVWLTQIELAELFQATKQNISLHIKNLLEEGELIEAATVKEYLTVQTEGERQVKRSVMCYSLIGKAFLSKGTRPQALENLEKKLRKKEKDSE